MKLPKTLKMPLLSGFGKRPPRYFTRAKLYAVSLLLSLVFKTVLRIYLVSVLKAYSDPQALKSLLGV
jgi:hypothetical protein